MSWWLREKMAPSAGAAEPARSPAPERVEDFLTEPNLLRLFDYWRSKRRGRLMPTRQDIDPLEIPWALSYMKLMDYDPETGFRYRLAGEGHSRVFGHANLKGRSFHDLLPAEAADVIEQRWAPLAEQQCVVCMKGLVFLVSDRTPIGERLLLPLSDGEDGRVTGLLGMTLCEWKTGEELKDAKPAKAVYFPVSEIP